VRREKVLEAALEVFAERGYQASMGDIARAAGITRTVLYHYFDSKQALLLAVLDSQTTELLRAVAPVMSSDATLKERAREAVDAMLTFAEQHPRAWRVVFGNPHEDQPEVLEALAQVHETMMTTGAILVASDAAALGFEADSIEGRIMAEALLGSGVAVMRWWLEHPKVPREQIADTMFNLLWHGLSGLRRRARTAA
jgi:AcrR family transcriptional regulator